MRFCLKNKPKKDKREPKKQKPRATQGAGGGRSRSAC